MVRPLPFDFEIFWPFSSRKRLVIEALGRRRAERPGDRAGQLHGVDQVLAGHLVVDAERDPAHRPIGLPLALDVAAGNGRLDLLVGIGVDIGHRAGRDVAADHRHLQHDARGLADRQERRIGGAAIGAERRQDDLHHLVVGGEHLEQRRVEAARGVVIGRASRTRSRSRNGRGRRAAGHCCGGRTRGTRSRTDPAPASTACRYERPASPCWGRCPAPCGSRPCRRRRRAGAS